MSGRTLTESIRGIKITHPLNSSGEVNNNHLRRINTKRLMKEEIVSPLYKKIIEERKR